MRVCCKAVLLVLLAVATGALVPDHFQEGDDGAFSSFLQLASPQTSANPAAMVKNETEPRLIKGKIKLNGRMYRTVCKCKSATSGSCVEPSRIQVHQEVVNARRGWSQQDLAVFLGSPREFRMVEVAKTPFDCMDGRNSGAVLGTPGGDMGEFMTMLAVAEIVRNRNISQAQVEQMFRHHIAGLQGRRFHYCTDEDAIEHLQQNVHVDGQTGQVVGLKITNPGNSLRDELLKDLPKPANQGSYYLKALLGDPGRFYMRRELAENAVRAFFRVLWDRDAKDADGQPLYEKINVVTYQGKPEEKAWLNMRAGRHCELDGMAPVFAPRKRVFINNPQAVSTRRRALAQFALSQLQMSTTISQLHTYLNRHGQHATEVYAEIRALASVPFYTIVVE